MSAPAWFLADQREVREDHVAEEVYLTGLEADVTFTPLETTECTFCGRECWGGLCRRDAHLFDIAGRY